MADTSLTAGRTLEALALSTCRCRMAAMSTPRIATDERVTAPVGDIATPAFKSVLCDIDGVLLRNNELIPGADIFVRRVVELGVPFALLTNYPSQTPTDLVHRLGAAGLQISERHVYTSAMALADFLQRQQGRRTAYVVGDAALTHELYKIGFTMTDIDPDFVIIGETRSYNWEMIQKASYFIMHGARFVATNPDVAGPNGYPACGALCAPIERITGKVPFYVGKPSPWIMRAALNAMNAHSESTVMIGDNMSTDIVAGVQAGLETILVLTGVTRREDLDLYPFGPSRVVENLEHVLPLLEMAAVHAAPRG
jgi:NagD protein